MIARLDFLISFTSNYIPTTCIDEVGLLYQWVETLIQHTAICSRGTIFDESRKLVVDQFTMTMIKTDKDGNRLR